MPTTLPLLVRQRVGPEGRLSVPAPTAEYEDQNEDEQTYAAQPTHHAANDLALMT